MKMVYKDQRISTQIFSRGTSYTFGHGLQQDGNTISVQTVDDFDGDNTLPMSAQGVQTVVGNVEALLATI